MFDPWRKDVAWRWLVFSLIGYVVFMILTFREVSGAWWQ